MKKLTPPFDLLKKAVNIFAKKENILFLVKIYLPILPFSILTLIQSYVPASTLNTNVTWFTLGLAVLQILSLLAGVFVAISGIIGVGKVVEGGELSVHRTFVSAWKNYWKFLLLSIVLALLYAFGFVLLIIPGLLFVVWFAFSRFMMVEKGLEVKEALLKSKELVKGVYWKVLGRLVVFGIFIMIVQIIFGIIPYGVGSILNSISGAFYILPLYLLYKELSV